MTHVNAVNNYDFILPLYSQVRKLLLDHEQREPIIQELELAVRLITIHATCYFVSFQKIFSFIMMIKINTMLMHDQTHHPRIPL